MSDQLSIGLSLEIRAIEHPGCVSFVLHHFAEAAADDEELQHLLLDVLKAPLFYQQATVFVLLTCWPAFAPDYFMPHNQYDMVMATFPSRDQPWETTLYHDVHELVQGLITVDYFTSKWILRVQKTCVLSSADNRRLIH